MFCSYILFVIISKKYVAVSLYFTQVKIMLIGKLKLSPLNFT